LKKKLVNTGYGDWNNFRLPQGTGTKFFQSPNLMATKIFNDQPCNNRKFSITNVAAIKNILITLLYGDQNIPIVT
jgi:hypothetical protein